MPLISQCVVTIVHIIVSIADVAVGVEIMHVNKLQMCKSAAHRQGAVAVRSHATAVLQVAICTEIEQ
jgi:hypothetical protein